MPETPRVFLFRQIVALDLAWGADLKEARRVLEQKGYQMRGGILPESQQQFIYPTKPRQYDLLVSCGDLEITLYDSGGISIAWTLQPQNEISMAAAAAIVRTLSGNTRFSDAAAELAQEVVAVLGSSLQEVHPRTITEDFTIVAIPLGPEDSVQGFVDRNRSLLARCLSTEDYELASETADLMLGSTFSFSTRDQIFCAWPASVIIGAVPGQGSRSRLSDAIGLLEYANFQILELDILEDDLEDLSLRSERVLETRKVSEAELRELAWTANHLAALFEKVKGGLEIFDDEMLSLFYERIHKRFRFNNRLETIESRKAQIEVVFDWSESTDRYSIGHRMESLVIRLIKIEIVLGVAELIIGIVELLIGHLRK